MNRLARERSPYLLQHAQNPVDWYPWGDEAFARARHEDKPIFLSIGYSTCHWCHVMERESFENPETAELMNRLFVSVKVDREERPDVDHIYMNAVQMLTGRGGWPMTMFLTPDGKPFYGGTYFPPEDRYGRPGFRTVLQQVLRFWGENRDRALEHAATIRRTITYHGVTFNSLVNGALRNSGIRGRRFFRSGERGNRQSVLGNRLRIQRQFLDQILE
jgi:uncharacterized protein YyaL (SSP411 family)